MPQPARSCRGPEEEAPAECSDNGEKFASRAEVPAPEQPELTCSGFTPESECGLFGGATFGMA